MRTLAKTASEQRAHFDHWTSMFTLAWEIERECWPQGGIATAILCEDLLDRVSEILA